MQQNDVKVNYVITNFTMEKVDAQIDEISSIGNQRFPKLNISIDGVEDKNGKILVSYTFLADYKDGDNAKAKDIGHIKMGGVVELTEPKEKHSEIMEQWKSKGNLPVNVTEEVINGLNFRCSATGTLIAYSLGLIPPLVISQTKVSEKVDK